MDRIIFEGENGKFGIEYGGIEYDDFDTQQEAQMIADAHDHGAETYEEAKEYVARHRGKHEHTPTHNP